MYRTVISGLITAQTGYLRPSMPPPQEGTVRVKITKSAAIVAAAAVAFGIGAATVALAWAMVWVPGMPEGGTRP
jgi:hypothetical protein